jgi:hypothetical protein
MAAVLGAEIFFYYCTTPLATVQPFFHLSLSENCVNFAGYCSIFIHPFNFPLHRIFPFGK